MGEVKQIRLCGLGGQGIVLAGTILGHAGVNDKKWVASSSSYGAEARGSACRAEVIISDESIIFPHVTKVDILIAMSQSAYDRYIEDVDRQNGIVIYDEQMVSVKEINSLKQVGIPATSVAVRELNNEQVANIVILCATIEMTKIVNHGALISALEKNIPARFKALNLEAAELGFKLGKEKLIV
jgi:2-oxoglutarate ferredoxin oxidoreductase subunit gamma